MRWMLTHYLLVPSSQHPLTGPCRWFLGNHLQGVFFLDSCWLTKGLLTVGTFGSQTRNQLPDPKWRDGSGSHLGWVLRFYLQKGKKKEIGKKNREIESLRCNPKSPKGRNVKGMTWNSWGLPYALMSCC